MGHVWQRNSRHNMSWQRCSTQSQTFVVFVLFIVSHLMMVLNQIFGHSFWKCQTRTIMPISINVCEDRDEKFGFLPFWTKTPTVGLTKMLQAICKAKLFMLIIHYVSNKCDKEYQTRRVNWTRNQVFLPMNGQSSQSFSGNRCTIVPWQVMPLPPEPPEFAEAPPLPLLWL